MTVDRKKPQANHSREKRYRCSMAGCGKAFTRLSHLQRHSLNHSETRWVCGRCNASFKRLDLLERHKARHTMKDGLAGGAGLGILQTRRKTISGFHTAEDSHSPLPSRLVQDTDKGKPSIKPAYPPSSCHIDTQNQHGDTGDDVSAGQQPSERSPRSSHSVLDAAHVADVTSPSMNLDELTNMYYDTSFDSVHFDVMGLACSPPATGQTLPHLEVEDQNYQQEIQQPSPAPDRPFSLNWAEIQSSRSEMAIPRQDTESACGVQHTTNIAPHPYDPLCLQPLIHVVDLQTSENEEAQGASLHPSGRIALSISKRDDILRLLSEIRPVTPEGIIIDGNTALLSMDNMHEYISLFFRFFNSSYPMVHVATLDIEGGDPIFLLSIIILGQTYKNKDTHQLSVYLYDALVPYILSGLMSVPIPDLPILQSFLILECYGMYRAGPYQRENAMLIHTLLFGAIRRVSRYHVRGGIMLPSHLVQPELGWKDFAYAEQYKRLILFVFMWDTQNVSCYSAMPNMSTHNIQVPLPCSQDLWEAPSEAAWEQIRKFHMEPACFNNMIKHLVQDGDKFQSLPMDRLSLTLVLHGIMSMCNDIAHFDNRSIYLSDIDPGGEPWRPWRRRMAHALETWKAHYDAYTMSLFQSMGDGWAPGSNHRQESVAILALYHTAHIVINCEIRHLQAAAGAKAIFGHMVMPEDRQMSENWVRDWVCTDATAADQAAWHAAQMIREGILNLKNWDVNGVFHYPWCLLIGTLTCWAFHHFGRGISDSREICRHPDEREMHQAQSRMLMNHMVSLMGSVSPTHIRRTLGKCCTHGLTVEVARYLRTVRWTAAFEAMKLLVGLSTRS
ncbi:transcriptional regulator family: Fungal Specific TF and C2H2 zinc finger [Aspergillus niger]|nr:transcriptional regulator family: Fungal Specific TF and C2H2 zinc finger [Aspergillus niger]